MRNGSLYLNFFDSPERSFFATFGAMRAAADATWATLWGCKRCGPFNTECLAAAGTQHKVPSGNTCTKPGSDQPLPPVPPATARA